MPFADQYVIGGTKSVLNKYMAHPPCPGFVEKDFKSDETQLVLLNSAQSFSLDTEKKIPDESYQFFTEEDKDAFVQKHLLDSKYDYETFSFNKQVSLERLISYARTRLWEKQKQLNSFHNSRIYIEIEDSEDLYEIDLENENLKKMKSNDEKKQPYLTMSFGFDLAVMLFLGHISWNIADAALFIDFDRVPNTYDPEIYKLINLLKSINLCLVKKLKSMEGLWEKDSLLILSLKYLVTMVVH